MPRLTSHRDHHACSGERRGASAVHDRLGDSGPEGLEINGRSRPLLRPARSGCSQPVRTLQGRSITTSDRTQRPRILRADVESTTQVSLHRIVFDEIYPLPLGERTVAVPEPQVAVTMSNKTPTIHHPPNLPIYPSGFRR